MVHRITLAFAALVLALLSGCIHQAARSARSALTRQPNIILIIADDLGDGELGCYDQRIIKTPNIDALAARGCRFTEAYAGSCVCAPSRCSLLTGLHTGHSAIRDNKELQPEGQQPLPAGTVTLATLLRQQGYATAAIGKWGLGPPGSEGEPSRHGFDLFFGYLCQRHAHNHCPTYLYRNNERVALTGNQEHWESGTIPPGATYAPDLLRQEAERFITDNRSRPFFLYFATPVPHAALQVPDDSLAQYSGRIEDSPYDGSKGYLRHPTPHAAYAAMLSRLDQDVGRILARLRELDLEQDTLVIFTSDNGPTYAGGADSAFFRSASGRRGLKGQLYEGGIRAPLIAAWPGRIAPAGTCSAVTANWDLLPTLASICRIPADRLPPNLDRIDISSAFLAGSASHAPAPPRPPLYWEYASASGAQAVRIGNLKAIRHSVKGAPTPVELYDLAADPGESTDISAAHPDMVARAVDVMNGRTRSSIPEWNMP